MGVYRWQADAVERGRSLHDRPAGPLVAIESERIVYTDHWLRRTGHRHASSGNAYSPSKPFRLLTDGVTDGAHQPPMRRSLVVFVCFGDGRELEAVNKSIRPVLGAGYRLVVIDQVASSDVEFAHELATAANRAALRFAGGTVRYRAKEDGTPVSDGDFAAEEAMLALLAQHRPGDAVISEERGTVGHGERRWILDPIDGTAQFVTGGEEWGTHVALEVAGEIVLGVITRPLKERRWWAARGHGAFADIDQDPFLGSTRLGTSRTASINGASIGLYRPDSSQLPDILAASGALVAAYGASHILDLVEGRIDGIISERCGFLWDHAPAVVLTVESGGRFTDPHGGVRADLQGGIYSNGAIHDGLHSIVVKGAIALAGDAA